MAREYFGVVLSARYATLWITVFLCQSFIFVGSRTQIIMYRVVIIYLMEDIILEFEYLFFALSSFLSFVLFF